MSSQRPAIGYLAKMRQKPALAAWTGLVAFALILSSCGSNSSEALEHLRAGLEFQNSGRFEEAVAQYDEAILLDSALAEAYNNRGLANFQLGEYYQALQDYQSALGIDPSLATTYSNRGGVFLVTREYDRAVLDYTEAIRLAPKDANAYGGRALAYTFLFNDPKAEADVKRAIELGYPSLQLEDAIELARWTRR